MPRRATSFLLLFFLFGGCGGSDRFGLTSTDNQLAGDWIAEKLNATGDRILLTFDPGTGERSVRITAIRPEGDSYRLSEGNYAIEKDRISFVLNEAADEIPNFTSSFAVTSKQLTLGTELYYRVAGSLDKPQLGGQIQISSSDEAVTVDSSAALTVPGSAPFAAGEVLVTYKDGRREKIVLKDKERSALVLQGMPKNLADLSFARLKLHDQLREATLKKIEELNKDPSVQSASRNMILKLQSSSDPTDPLFDNQWNLELMSITDTWGETAAANEVVVAVVDTGIVPSHPDLAGRLLINHCYDFVHRQAEGIGDLSLDGNGPDPDCTDPGDQRNLGLPGGSSWHGTHIAGIIAAATDNGIGIAGTAGKGNIKILPLRAMGKGGDGTLDDVAQAVYYAAKLPNIAECGPVTVLDDGGYSYNETTWTCHINPGRPKAKVINLSLGAEMSAVDAMPLTDAINEAYAAGVLVVVAAGNLHKNSVNFYPAANANVLSIGSVYPNLAFASSYSNYGNTQFLVAPGGSTTSGVLSTVTPAILGGYGRLSGTSQSAAHVSAVAAMLISEKPALTPAQVKEVLRLSAIDLGAAGKDVYFGYGLVNPCGAVLSAKGVSPAGTGSLKISSDSVDFGTLGSSHTVLVTGGCGGTPVTGITAGKMTGDGKNWLAASLTGSLTPTQVALKVDRTGLPAGDYSGSVTLNSSAGSRVIQVKMRVAAATLAGEGDGIDSLRGEIEDFLSGTTGYKNTIDIGEIILLLVDSKTGEPKYYTKTDLTANYRFLFGGIAPGSYHVLAGVDGNKDGKICVSGEEEICLGYPTATGPEAIEVTESTLKNDLVIVY